MNLNESQIIAAGRTRPQVQRSVSGRAVELTAPVRCQAYAAYSEMLGSPHDIDPRQACGARIGLEASLPHARALDALLTEIRDADLSRLRREYSGLFEVGSEGPPVPIREDLQTGQRSGTREEIVRFYDYFGYQLAENFAWAPDHLSVELEFMHFLCYREAQQDDNQLSYQLAQLDFLDRHLGRWVPKLVLAVDELAPGSLYSRVLASLNTFLEGDIGWQRATVVEQSGEAQA